MLLFNELAAATNAYVRCAAGAPNLSGGNFAFALRGAFPQRGTQNALFCIMPTAGSNAPLMILTQPAAGDVRVLVHDSNLFVDSPIGFASVGAGSFEPYLIVGTVTDNAGTKTLTVHSRRVGQGSKNTSSDTGTVAITTSSGEWGFGTMSSTPTFYSNNTGDSYLGPVRVSTYAALGNVPDCGALFDALWLDYEGVLDNATWGTSTGDHIMGCGVTLNNHGTNTPMAIDDILATTAQSDTVVRQIVSTPTISWYSSNGSASSGQANMTFVGQHRYKNPYTLFPGYIRRTATTYAGTLTGAQKFGVIPSTLESLVTNQYSSALKIGVTGQSWQAGFNATSSKVINGTRRDAGTLLAQAMLAVADTKAIGVLYDPEKRDNATGFTVSNGPRMGYKFTTEYNEANGENTITTWPARFSTGGETGNVSGRLTIHGGEAWISTTSAVTTYTEAAFDRRTMPGISNSDTLLLGRVVLAYPGGPNQAISSADTSATITGASGTTFTGETVNLNTLTGTFTCATFTGGTIVSGANTTPDTITATLASGSGTIPGDIGAYLANPEASNQIYGLYNETQDELVPVTAMSEVAGTYTFSIANGTTLVWAATNVLRFGPINLVRMEIGSIVDASVPGTNIIGRIRITKTHGLGGGPLAVLGRYGWAQNKSGLICGGIGTGGTTYLLWDKNTLLGFPNRLAKAMGVQGFVFGHTAISQAEHERIIDKLKTATTNITGIFIPPWAFSNSSFATELNSSTRNAYRAACVSRNVPYVDLVDSRGRTAARILAAEMLDGTHSNLDGYFAAWQDYQEEFSAGSSSFRNRGGSRGRLLWGNR